MWALPWVGDRRPTRTVSAHTPSWPQSMCTYWEHDGDTAPHSLCAGQVGLLAHPQVLCLATVALPAGYGSSKEQHLDALTRGQRSNDFLAPSLADNVNLGGWARGGRGAQGGRAVGAVDHCELRE
jgi:hypothetical protein